MKRLLIALVAGSFLATPMAFAQPAAAFEVAQVKERRVESTSTSTETKKLSRNASS